MGKNEIGKILPMIVSLDYDFTKAEKKVAKYILDNTSEVIYLTIIDFAERVSVGEATIIRFCRKLGFKGFQDFKMILAQEFSLNSQNNRIISDIVKAQDDLATMGKKIANGSELAMAETLMLVDYKIVAQVVKLMEKVKRIYFFGVGYSGLTCIEAKYKFMALGLKVEAYTDNHFMAMAAATLDKDDLVIGLSHSGRAIETIKGIEVAKNSGAKTVAITHHAKSPITKIADYTILNGSKEGPLQGGAISTKISQLLVLELIYTKLLMNNEEKATELKKKEREAVSTSIY